MKKINRYIRVANIIEEGRIGGPQKRILMIASALNKKIDVTLIFPKENSKELQKNCDSLDVKYLTTYLTTIKRNWITILKYLILFPFEVIILSRKLKKHCFDIVHISGGCWQYKGVLAAKLARIKVVWELNDTFAPVLNRGIFFFLSRLANSFIFASQRTKNYYKKLVPIGYKSFLIQSPVDVNFFDPALDYPLDKFIKKTTKKKILIGTICNVNPVKGLVNFLKTANKLSIYSNKINFVVIGSIYDSQKGYHMHLMNIITQLGIKNFFFLNSRKDVRPLLKSIDIYVCSSNNESSPLSVWEAMSMKKAIVSTDVGDVRKFIKNNVNGFIVKVGDSDSLAKAIIKLIKNPKLKHIFGKSVRKVAKNKLDLKICKRLHSEAYQKIIYNV